MDIIFKGPRFFAQEDEKQFFEWIYTLPSYKEIVGSGLDFTLQLNEPVDDESIIQLLILFRRWSIETSSLSSLRRQSNDEFILWDKELSEAVK